MLVVSSMTSAVNLPEISANSISQDTAANYRQRELIVRFADLDANDKLPQNVTIRGPLSRRAIRTMISDNILAGSNIDKEYDNIAPGLTVVKLPEDSSVLNAVSKFSKSPNVLFAEPNYKYKLLISPNIANLTSLYSLGQAGDSQDDQTGNADDAAETVVAVVDTGVDYQHPDLTGKMWVNTTELNGSPDVDDDNNGYVDDIYGYDFAGASSDNPGDGDSDPLDSYFHGTHVAGVVTSAAGQIENTTGNVKIMALKVFADDLDIKPEVFASDAIEAIMYAIDNGASIINASWGGSYYSQSLYNAVEQADSAGLLFVAAAGNDGTNNDLIPVYPASFDLENVIATMSTDADGNISAFSNYGPGSVDVAAQGSDVLSTTPTYQTFTMLGYGLPTDYATLSGTSSAAPQISGACALLWSTEPTLPHLSIKSLLLQTTDQVLKSPRMCLSGGSINLFDAIQQVPAEHVGKVLNTKDDPNDPNNLYDSIQAAINAASDGDVLIAQAGGEFVESIDFIGKAITIRSGNIANPDDPNLSPEDTIISGISRVGSVVKFVNNEGPNSVISGFTISWGNTDYGGGIRCNGSSPTITDCIITNNTVRYYGAGIDCVNSSPTIRNCTITNNTTSGAYGIGGGINMEESSGIIADCIIRNNFADNVGGGIACYNADPKIINCIISNNAATYLSGGIDLEGSYPEITNCTIVVDEADASQDGGIFAYLDSVPVITNCILWGNGDDLLNCSATYSCIEDGDEGEGNISQDPGFATGPLGDYYLLQESAGQLSNSPCVNTGKPESNPELLADTYTTRTDGGADVDIIDMGAHYNSVEPLMFALNVAELDLRNVPLPPARSNGYVDPNTGMFRQYEVVRLTAHPKEGYRVREWAGTNDDISREIENTVTILDDTEVTIKFEAVPYYQLHTEVIGGHGAISPHLRRGEMYPEGTVVSLVASPEQSYIVDQWTGTDDDTLWSNNNTVTMDSNKEVTVMFRQPKSLHVPGQYHDIGSAIEAAHTHGDKVIVSAGVYNGSFDFMGKAITVASEHPDDPCSVAKTIIQIGLSPAFIFQSGEGNDSVVDGFTIQGLGDIGPIPAPAAGGVGMAGVDTLGGAIRCLGGSSPTLAHLVIRDCVARGQDGEDASFVFPAPPAASDPLEPLEPLEPLPDPEGQEGEDSAPGLPGDDGVDGADGADGVAGLDGQDGFPGGNAGSGYGGAMYFDADSSPVILNCTMINCQAIGGDGGYGGQGQDGQDGQDGQPGQDGQAGQNGGSGAGDGAAGAGGNGGDAGNGGAGGFGGNGGAGGKGGDGGEALGGAMYFGPNCRPTIRYCKIISGSTRQGLGNYGGAGGNGGIGGAGADAGAAGDGGSGEPEGQPGADGAPGMGGFGGNGGFGGDMGINGTRSWAGGIYFGENCEIEIFETSISDNAATRLVPSYSYGGGNGGNGGDAGEGGGDADPGIGGIGGDGGAGGPANADPNELNTGPGAGGTGGVDGGSDGFDGAVLVSVTTSYGGANYYDLGSNVKIVNSTISNNKSRQLDGTGEEGGGEFYTQGCKLVIENSNVNGNQSGFNRSGGGQYFSGFCSVDVTDCNYVENSAGGDGGGLFCLSDCTLNIKDSSFVSNESIGYYGSGGGVYAGGIFDFDNISWYNGGTVTIDNGYFANNEAAFGGGLYWYGDQAEVSIVNSVISNNTAEHGGGMYFSSGDPVIRSCSIISNRAEARYFMPDDVIYDRFYAFFDYERPYGGGAGIFCWSSDATIENCFITNNSSSGSGGGVYFGGDPTLPKLRNCLVRGNTAVRDGGGVVSYWHTSPTISNCTIVENSASNPADSELGSGGGLSCSYESNTTLVNSILWDNTAAKGNQIAIGSDKEPFYIDRPAKVTVSYSDVMGGRNAVYTEPGRVLNWLDGNIDSNPLFVGSTYLLSQTAAGQTVNSPAVNAGNNTAAALNLTQFTTRSDSVGDQGIVDMGFHYTIGANQYRLTVKVIGGHGTVKPGGGLYNRYAVVTLVATPDLGYQVKWIGTDNDSTKALVNTVTMDSDKTVTVEFVQSVGATVTVPGNYPTIQEAVTNAKNGDTIVVDTGTYYGGYQGYLLRVDKSILITSRNPDDPSCVAATILDGYRTTNDYANIGVAFASNTDSKTVLNGFTIRNCGGNFGDGDDGDRDANHPNGGDGAPGEGAGILIAQGASPIIKNCVITNNLVQGGAGGAGVAADGTNGLNAGRGGWGGWARGGGIYCGVGSKPIFINCTVENNVASGGSAGDGGDGDDDGGQGNYGGNYSRTQGYDIDPDSLNIVIVPGSLWRVWDWDYASTYGPLYGEPNLTSYIGDYRWYSGYGGGVFCDQRSEVAFIDCDIRGNRTRGGMSGIGGLYSGSDRNLDPLVAYEIPSYGAGVYCGAQTSITFSDCTFEDNIASEVPAGADPNHRLDPYVGYGGGVCAEISADVMFMDCNFVDNQADTGGGIYLSNADAMIIDCNVVTNRSLRGGGLFGIGGSINIISTEIVNNRAAVDVNDPNEQNILASGAGIYCLSGGLNIQDCNFAGNIADFSGGGAYLRSVNNASIFNSLIINNAAGRDGGGISANWLTSPNISNCTFVGNSAIGNVGQANRTGYGGALYCSYESDCTVIDSIFWNNQALNSKGNAIAVGTGFEFDARPATLSISYSDVRGGRAAIWLDTGCTLNFGEGNINADPLFVDGRLGDYYLSQRDSNESKDSPCVNTGSSFISQTGLVGYTTRTDEEADTGVVDMGYHHPSTEPCRLADVAFDGIIDFHDFARLAQRWLQDGCTRTNGWCDGADITSDARVDMSDVYFLSNCWLVSDVTPPVPNPSRWEEEPRMQSGSSITMTAETAYDAWGWDVEYYFECIGDSDCDSGWQDDPTYTVTSLEQDTEYGFRFKTRDGVGNETEWSPVRYTGRDNIPPAPAPHIETIFATSETSVTMSSSIAYDVSGVQYYFEAVTPGGHDSGWQDDPNYTDIDLTSSTEYGYRVRARDMSTARNVTAWSSTVYVTTLASADTTPPTPNPMTWDETEDPNGFDGTPREISGDGSPFDYSATMIATTAVDDSGGPVEYQFQCTTEPGFSSLWQAEPNYTVLVGRRGQGHVFRVRARDQFGNMTEWSVADVAD